MATADALTRGREALRRTDWDAARAAFEEALAAGETPEAHEGLSWAAWYVDDAECTFGSRERAHRLYRAQGDICGAARTAIWLAVDHMEFRGAVAIANGWLARARRLLADQAPCAEQGWLALHEGAIALELEGDSDRARCAGFAAVDLGQRLGDPDVEMIGLALAGFALVCEGRVSDGMGRLDEAAAAAVGGELEQAVSVGWCCCYVIYACEGVRDHERAEQWCLEVEELSARLRMRYLFRVCRAHLAGVMIGHGAWDAADAELREVTEELAETRPAQAGEGVVRIAELRRRQGRLDEAVELFGKVADHPIAAVGSAAIALDTGRPHDARSGLERFLRGLPETNRTQRIAALELLVEARAALDDAAGAARALDELRDLAGAFETLHLRASAEAATGALALARGELVAARDALERAVALFERGRSPYEAIRARIGLARVLAELREHGAAESEARAAEDAAHRLGAAGEVARARAALAGAADDDAGRRFGLTARELEVLRLVAVGYNTRRIADELVVSRHTVHRHVANVRTKLGVSSRAAAVARAADEGVL